MYNTEAMYFYILYDKNLHFPVDEILHANFSDQTKLHGTISV